MSEKPILFATEMVRAILDGRKTMTRRVINPQPIGHIWNPPNDPPCLEDDTGKKLKQPYQRGDILWVRETWCYHSEGNWYGYKADGDYRDLDLRWKPSIFMPRVAARLFLKVTNVRVERLQDITVEDVIAEGLEVDNEIRNPDPETHESIKNWNYQYAQFQYKELWDSLNAKRGYGWDKSPWVWVIEFERTEVKF